MKGINRTISAQDEEKIKIMKIFEKNDKNKISIGKHEYEVNSFSDNLGKINIFELKRDQAKLYFRPSGTGPDVRFYIFGKKETYLEEINTVMKIIKEKYS